MSRSGTLVVCVQNLDFSGANQVVLNIVSGKIHQSNVVVLSPKIGTFAARFVDSGAAVRIGDLEDLLTEIRDVFCIICNTIMTAPIVVEMSSRVHPVVWILHEWWDDEMITENLKIRNYQNMTLDTVKQALAKATTIVFVCESQRALYKPTAPSAIIFVGVPDPLPRFITSTNVTSLKLASSAAEQKDPEVFTFLCLGIICPRKNQLWTVKLFKQFAKDKQNVRLKVVGARYTRVYEIEYLDQVKAEIGDDPRIELFDVTDNVDPFYQTADCLILTSLNEVTPMVISEALSWSIPVLSTNIAGIPEMFTDGKEGYLFAPGDDEKALAGMESVFSNSTLRQKMAVKARRRFETAFDLDVMVDSYRQVMLTIAPPVLLVDMDGALVDWDKGFMQAWDRRCGIDRSKSYYMEDCVDDISYRKDAITCYKTKGFFENLEPMEGALEAIQEMQEEGFQVMICTSPVKHSKYCAQEKLNWVVEHLGEEWLDRVILCQDKASVIGDILIDDKPMNHLCPKGKHTIATWKQVVFDAPFNRQVSNPRIKHWKDWRSVIFPMLGKTESLPLYIESAKGGANSNDLLDGLSMRSGRDRATSDALLAGYQIPTMDMPHVSRPIGMLHLRRDSSNSSSEHRSVHSLGTGMQPQDIQRGVDMLQLGSEALSPEDLATIRSASASLMHDDADLPSEDGSAHGSAGSTGAGTGTASVAGSFASGGSARVKSLQESAAQRQEAHGKEVEATQRKMALDSDETDSDGLQIFRSAYNFWKQAIGAPKKTSP